MVSGVGRHGVATVGRMVWRRSGGWYSDSREDGGDGREDGGDGSEDDGGFREGGGDFENDGGGSYGTRDVPINT